MLHSSMIPELRARGAAGQRAGGEALRTSADERCGISICGKVAYVRVDQYFRTRNGRGELAGAGRLDQHRRSRVQINSAR